MSLLWLVDQFGEVVERGECPAAVKEKINALGIRPAEDRSKLCRVVGEGEGEYRKLRTV